MQRVSERVHLVRLARDAEDAVGRHHALRAARAALGRVLRDADLPGADPLHEQVRHERHAAHRLVGARELLERVADQLPLGGHLRDSQARGAAHRLELRRGQVLPPRLRRASPLLPRLHRARLLGALRERGLQVARVQRRVPLAQLHHGARPRGHSAPD